MRLASVAIGLTATVAWAVPPTFCREHMVGVITSATGIHRTGRVRARLRVTNFIGDLDVAGRFACDAPSGYTCPVEKASISGENVGASPDGLGLRFRLRLVVLDPTYRVLCEIDAAVPLVWHNCISGLSGSYSCADGDHGTIALASLSCRQCPMSNLPRP